VSPVITETLRMKSEVAGNHGNVPDAGDSEQSRYRPRHRTVSSTTMMSESLTRGPNQASMRTRPAGARAAGGAQTGGAETVTLEGDWARSAKDTVDETAAARSEVLSNTLNRCMWAPRPNGSRLSCGRNARGRKELEPQTKRPTGEATQFLPTCERPPASSAC
jgi:hypothetical protein